METKQCIILDMGGGPLLFGWEGGMGRYKTWNGTEANGSTVVARY